jgi:hypothetical protein
MSLSFKDSKEDCHFSESSDQTIYQFSLKPVTVIPSYWYKSGKPHSSQNIPLCFFDVESNTNELQRWKDGVDYLDSLNTVQWESNSLFISLFQKMIQPVAMDFHGGLVQLKAGNGFRMGCSMKYYISSPLILFTFTKHSYQLSELKQYWNESSDFVHWKEIQTRVEMFKRTHPNSSQPFDDFLLSDAKALEPKHWKTLQKIAFIPDVKPEDIESKFKQFHQWMIQSLQAAISSASTKPFDKLTFFKLLADIHHRFTLVLPFRFGNGRIIRCWIGFLLMKFGFLPIPCCSKASYLEAIRSNKLLEFFIEQNQKLKMYMTNEKGDVLLDDDHVLNIKQQMADLQCNNDSHDTDPPMSERKPSGKKPVEKDTKENDTKENHQSITNQLIELLPLISNQAFEQIVQEDKQKYSSEQWLTIAEAAVSVKKNELVLVLLQKQLFDPKAGTLVLQRVCSDLALFI